jgi:hypothetical protein
MAMVLAARPTPRPEISMPISRVSRNILARQRLNGEFGRHEAVKLPTSAAPNNRRIFYSDWNKV